MIAIYCIAIMEINVMANGTITIRTDPEIEERIAELAKVMDRSRNWVIEDAIKQYLENQSWQVEGIKNAQESLKNGKGVPYEKVLNRIQDKIDRRAKDSE